MSNQKRLNDLVYFRYNRALKRRFDAYAVQDPIAIDITEDCNKWFLGKSFDDADNKLTTMSMKVGRFVLLQEPLYHPTCLTRGTSTSNATHGPTSSTLINEDYEDKERV